MRCKVLLSRQRECRRLDDVVADVRVGKSRALVARGDAGIGKSALLEYVLGQASDCRTVLVTGVEAEQDLAFAALHQLCAPMLDRLALLPRPQQDALRSAFGLSGGDPSDRFMLGLATLGLLAETARERALLCVIDDAHWLDRPSAQVLAFAARRLRAESVAMLFAVRETAEQAEASDLAGLDELLVTGLPEDAARTLLASFHPGRADDQVLDRIVAESQGNPSVLLELSRGLTPMELIGGLRSTALPPELQARFRRQTASLSATTRQVLLLAAAEPVGDPVLVLRAVERLGIAFDAAALEAEAAGLVEFAARVKFQHPLLRSAIYHAASPQERQAGHRALAQVTDPVADADRRAWHRAQAATQPEESVAAELERCAGRAQARGGLSAAAAFLEGASGLTPDPLRRAQRALAAAAAKYQSGMLDEALRLLSVAEASPLDDLRRAQADLLRARIEFSTDRGRDAPSLLLKVAAQLTELDPQLTRETYLDALRAGWFTAHLAGGAGLRDVAETVRAVRAPAAPPRAGDLLLDGLALRYTDGYAAGTRALRQALWAFRDPDLSGEDGLRWLWFASTTALDLLEDETCDILTSRFVRFARDAGALATLPTALTLRIIMRIFTGDLAAADSLLDELASVTERTGMWQPAYGAQLLAAWQGREDVTAELITATTDDAERRGEGVALIVAGWMRAVLYNSLGRYDDALVAAQQATESRQEMGILTVAPILELVTAAARAGRAELAADALNRLAQLTQSSGTDWALGVQACCRALVSDADVAEPHYREAIDRLARTRIRGQLARARLHYGEWLRRHNRRSDARDQLREAHGMFTAMGMQAFAALAADELGATGQSVRKHAGGRSGQLTAQEAQIVSLARDGLSNAAIAGRLFISPRTVEWHLGKSFAKLGIASRRQLRR